MKFLVLHEDNDATEAQFDTLDEAVEFVKNKQSDAYEEYAYVIYQAIELRKGVLSHRTIKVKP